MAMFVMGTWPESSDGSMGRDQEGAPQFAVMGIWRIANAPAPPKPVPPKPGEGGGMPTEASKRRIWNKGWSFVEAWKRQHAAGEIGAPLPTMAQAVNGMAVCEFE